MLLPRLIPTLLVDSNLNLVKTKAFNERNYIGEPLNSAYIFSGFEADELIVLDIDASRLGRTISSKFVKALATFTSVPLCVGGGIYNLNQIKNLLALGVERIALSASLNSNFKLLEEASNRFGSSSITVIINCFKDEKGSYLGSFGLPRKNLSKKIDQMCIDCQNAGAGELVINNINLEGSKQGYDVSLMKSLNLKLSIPLIALGGCGQLKHIEDLLSAAPISGVACGSFLIYAPKKSQVLLSYPDKSTWLKANLTSFNKRWDK